MYRTLHIWKLYYSKPGVLKLRTIYTFLMHFEFLNLYFGNQIWKFMYIYFGKFSGNFDFFVLWIFIDIKIVLLLKSLRTTALMKRNQNFNFKKGHILIQTCLRFHFNCYYWIQVAKVICVLKFLDPDKKFFQEFLPEFCAMSLILLAATGHSS